MSTAAQSYHYSDDMAMMNSFPPEFDNWLGESSIALNNCKPKHGAHGNGLYATSSIHKGDCIASVPDSMVVTPKSVAKMAEEVPFLHNLLYRNDKGDKCPRNPGEGRPNVALARFFMYVMLSVKKGTPDKAFGTYVRAMPAARDINLPLSWTDDEVDLMEGTSIYDGLLAKRAHLKLAYADFFSSEELRREIGEYVAGDVQDKASVPALSKELSFYDFLLIEQWILSRSMQLKVDSDAPEDLDSVAMIPIVDIANHSSSASNAHYEYLVDEKRVVLVATRDIDASQEITINYSPTKSAAEFLYCYGFIPKEFETSKSLRAFYPVMDPTYRRVLDEQYVGKENTKKTDMDLTYEYMAQFLDRPQNEFKLRDFGDFVQFSDEFIYLLAAAGHLKIELDTETGFYELRYGSSSGPEVDLENVQQWILDNVSDKDKTEIHAIADSIAARLVEYLLEEKKKKVNGDQTSHCKESPIDAQYTSWRLKQLEVKLLEKSLALLRE